MAGEAPALAQDVEQQPLARGGGLPVHAVVGPHHGLHPALDHEVAERGQVGLVQIALARANVEVVAVLLRAAVDREVLGGGARAVVARVVALQALHEGHSQPPRQVRVLAVGLLPPPPARVAEDVDVGRPEGEPLVASALALARELVVLGTALVADHDRHLVDERRVERGRDADRLREDGGDARARDAVKGLVPPFVGRHTEPRDRGSLVRELRDLLLERHARHEVARSHFGAEIGIEVGRVPGRPAVATRRGQG